MTGRQRNFSTLLALLAGMLFWVIVGMVVAATTDGRDLTGCEPEPASQWAPAGWVCPPSYGTGTASTWGGPGAARNDCSHAIRDSVGCPPIRITSHTTGLVITVVPTEWCMCWVGVVGPHGETERIVDLGPELVRALGLPGPGLWPVTVESALPGILVAPVPSQAPSLLPDTATAAVAR